jgi:hypothetical protein
MKRTIFTLLAFVVVANFAFGYGGTPKTITPCKTPPKIDGVMDSNDPWTATGWVPLAAAKTANTTSGMSAHFQLSYDNTNLYLIVEQMNNVEVDTDAVAIPNSYERDCFEVFVKMDTLCAADAKYEADGTYQFRMGRASIYPNRFDDPRSDHRFIKTKGFQIGQVDGATGFMQEWQMPWAALANTPDSVNWDKKQFKFEAQAADNTTGKAGGRSQQMYWNDNSDNEWDNTKTFTVVNLSVPVGVKSVNISNNITMNTLVTDELRLSTTVKSLSIYDVTGKVVVDNLKNVSSVNLSNLSAGIYFVRSNNEFTTKIVKR